MRTIQKKNPRKTLLDMNEFDHWLVDNGWRRPNEVQSMTPEDKRNTVIVELSNHKLGTIKQCQAMSNEQLCLLCASLHLKKKGCTNCGNDVTNAKFCTSCGTPAPPGVLFS